MKTHYKHFSQRRHWQLQQTTQIQQYATHNLNTVSISIAGGVAPVSCNPLRG